MFRRNFNARGIIEALDKIMSDAEDEDGGVHDETEVSAEDSDHDAIEIYIYPRIIILESDCELDIEIDNNNDFNSEDNEPLSSFVSS
jgi:hypothetical protein